MTDRATWLRAQPFTLVLSAGFFGFFAHAGVLKALEERGIAPRRVVGSSAGAIAGGLWAAGLTSDDLARELAALRREHFWDPGLPLGGVLRGEKFLALLRELLGPTGVAQVEHAPRAFAAVAHDVLAHRTRILDRGPLAEAIRASAALPGLFRPIRVEGRLLVDAGVLDRAGMAALAPGERAMVHYLPHQSPWSRLRRRQRAAVASTPERAVLYVPNQAPLHPYDLRPGMGLVQQLRDATHAWLDGAAVHP